MILFDIYLDIIYKDPYMKTNRVYFESHPRIIYTEMFQCLY